MRSLEVADFVPLSKLDRERAERAVALGYPGIAPVIPQLLEWLQDINWPVAQILQPMLAGIGLPIAHDVRAIITGDDLVWTLWMLEYVVAYSPELIEELRPEIEALAGLSGDDEANDVAEAARQLLS